MAYSKCFIQQHAFPNLNHAHNITVIWEDVYCGAELTSTTASKYCLGLVRQTIKSPENNKSNKCDFSKLSLSGSGFFFCHQTRYKYSYATAQLSLGLLKKGGGGFYESERPSLNKQGIKEMWVQQHIMNLN